jgi:dTDP-glucose 4,6-dehydratase
MRLLVTGGCGFIGSNFIRHLLREHPEDEVLNLDKLTYAGNPENLRDVEGDPRYAFLRGDICEEADVRKAFEWGPEAVVNFAAETHVDRSITDPEAFVRTDVLGTFRLLNAAREAGIRFVQISTDEVYGSIAEGSFTEESPLQPNSPYAASKAGADLLVRSYVRTYGIDAVIVRSSNNYGPYQYPEKVIPLFITNLLEGRESTLGTGFSWRTTAAPSTWCSAGGRAAPCTTWGPARRGVTWSSPGPYWLFWERMKNTSRGSPTDRGTTSVIP